MDYTIHIYEANSEDEAEQIASCLNSRSPGFVFQHNGNLVGIVSQKKRVSSDQQMAIAATCRGVQMGMDYQHERLTGKRLFLSIR